MMSSKMAPIHPGEVLFEDFMQPRGLTANRLAIELRVPANRISDIVRRDRGITPETALRLAAFFETSADLWLGLQMQYDLQIVEDALGEKIRRDIVPAESIVPVANRSKRKVLRNLH